MIEHPIIFSAPMVRAILEGRKTQTRRPCKQANDPISGIAASVHQDGSGLGWIAWWPHPVSAETTRLRYPGNEGFPCPYGVPGDRLWVREGFAYCPDSYKKGGIIYRADGGDPHVASFEWLPSIFMPRWASRITLEVVSVRVERVQEIGGSGVIAEGLEERIDYDSGGGKQMDSESMREEFADAWDAIYAKRGLGWDVDPWVWVVELKRVTP